MNIILYLYALHTGAYEKKKLSKNTIETILLCINLYSFSAQTMLEIYVTWANILSKHFKKDLVTSNTYM